MWLASNLPAAIPLGTSQTFNTAPPASSWATRSIPGAGSTFTDAAALDAVVQTNSAADISIALPATATVPPATQANARWNSSGLYLQTRPAGNAATLLMATFINDGPAELNGLRVGYDFNTFTPGADQIPGHRVYYSMDGAQNSWVLIPSLSGDNQAGFKSAVLDLSFYPLAAGQTMYLLWADDNGDGTADPSYTIDNFIFGITDEPPCISVQPVANTNVLQCSAFSMSVEVCGMPPLTLQWFKDGVPIDPGPNPSAATTTLVVSNVQPADAGSYVARVSNALGVKDSNPATVTVTPDNLGPTMVYALGASDLTTITITFSEPMNDAAGDAFFYAVCRTGGPDCLLPYSAVLSPDRLAATLTTDPRQPGVAYAVYATDPIADLCNNNVIAPDARIPLNQEVTLLAADSITQWKYNHEGVDLGTAWRVPAYDDSSWSSGLAALGFSGVPPADPPLRTQLPVNNANFPNSAIPTYYFRAHFEFPGDPAAPSSRLKFRAAIDDYAYVYINGTEVYRDPFLGAVGSAELAFPTYTGGPARTPAWEPYVYLPLTSVVAGDNVVAVQLKQQSPFSGDIYMALELVAEFAEVVPVCPRIIDHPDSILLPISGPVIFTVRASGTSLQYEWQKDGIPIAGATQQTHTISSPRSSDLGTYRVRVFNNCNGVNAVLSNPAYLQVHRSAPPRIAEACGLAGETNILVTFTNGPLDSVSAQNMTNYTVSGQTVERAVLLANGHQVLLTTSPRTIGGNYSLTIRDVVDVAIDFPGTIFPNPTVISPLAQELRLIDWHHVWKYTDACQDGSRWVERLFDDSVWASGPAVLGVETTAATLMALTNITGDGVLTPITAPNAGGANNHYFRAHFTLPVMDLSEVTWQWDHLRDDGAIVYLNGREGFRGNITNSAGLPIVCLDQASSHEADRLDQTNTTSTTAIDGDNVIAVHLKQNGTNSSDLIWALQLTIQVPVYRAPRPTLCIFLDMQPGHVSLIWPCPASIPATGYVLQAADNLAGPWAAIPSANSPYVIPAGAARRFYRLCQGTCP